MKIFLYLSSFRCGRLSDSRCRVIHDVFQVNMLLAPSYHPHHHKKQ